MKAVGEAEYDDYAVFETKVQDAVKRPSLAVTPAEMRLIARAVSWRSPTPSR